MFVDRHNFYYCLTCFMFEWILAETPGEPNWAYWTLSNLFYMFNHCNHIIVGTYFSVLFFYLLSYLYWFEDMCLKLMHEWTILKDFLKPQSNHNIILEGTIPNPNGIKVGPCEGWSVALKHSRCLIPGGDSIILRLVPPEAIRTLYGPQAQQCSCHLTS